MPKFFLLLAVGVFAANSSTATTPVPVPMSALTAPDSFTVLMETSRGPVTIIFNRDWAPIGVDRIYSLVKTHYYDGVRIFRVAPGFVAQFGLAATPKMTATYKHLSIKDDPVKHSNIRGTLTFARPNYADSRTTQLFINLNNNPGLDHQGGIGFPPIGHVISGMAAVDSFTSQYNGKMPNSAQDSIELQGNAYLLRAYPKLDFIKTAKVVKEWK